MTAAVSIGAAAGASAEAQPAHAARSCGVGSGQGYGYSYLTSLTVLRTSCSVGRNLAHHHGRVAGWRCAKKRLASSPVQYDDRVTCSRGARVVRWTFTQNT
jgi:hypothetical protein